MMEKVKLTKLQAESLERIRANVGNEEMVKYKIGRGWEIGTNQFLNEMTLDELINVLYIGYDVEEEYKVEDWVVYINHKGEKFVGKVEESLMDGFLKTDMYMGCKVKQAVEPHTLRHATPEEIKAEQERRVWKSIGRSYREIKEGDKYKVDCFGRTISDEYSRRILIDCLNNGESITFYPVESAISFGGESHDN